MSEQVVKFAQVDMSGVADAFRNAGGRISDGISGIGRQASDLYSSMDPNARAVLMRGLLGAGAGATALGLTHAMSPRDPDERAGGTARSALLGALLGGTAGVALPAGYRMLRGDIKFPGESRTGPFENISNKVLGGATSNYGAITGGTLAGLAAARKNKGLIGGFMQGPTASTVKDMLAKSTLDPQKAENLAGVLKPGVTARQLRGVANAAMMGDVDYRSLTKFHKMPWLKKVPLVGRHLKGIRLPALKALKNMKDPRVKLLAAILAGVATGKVIQTGIEGSV